eukprot:2465101-Rhodomonas_salina.3
MPPRSKLAGNCFHVLDFASQARAVLDMNDCTMLLRPCYAESGTDLGYAPTRRGVPTDHLAVQHYRYYSLPLLVGTCAGTDLAAMSYGLSPYVLARLSGTDLAAMLLPGAGTPIFLDVKTAEAVPVSSTPRDRSTASLEKHCTGNVLVKQLTDNVLLGAGFWYRSIPTHTAPCSPSKPGTAPDTSLICAVRY